MKRTQSENLLGYLMIFPALLASLLLFLTPYLYTVGLSFYDVKLTRPGGNFVGFDNYIKYFTSPSSQIILVNSFVFIFAILPAVILIAFALASLLHKDIKGKKFFRTINILPWVVSGTTASFMFLWLFNESSGLINVLLKMAGLDPVRWLSDSKMTFAVIMYCCVWKAFPFALLLFLSGMQAISPEYYEAVDVDGGGYFSKLFFVTIPFLKGHFKIILVYSTLGLLNTVDVMRVISGPKGSMKVIGYSMYTEAFTGFNISMSAAVGVIMLLLNIMFAVLYMKFFKIDEGA